MTLAEAVRARTRTLGRVSLAMVPIGMVLHVVSFLQQATYLIDPSSSSRGVAIAVLVVVSVLGVLGMACGLLAATARPTRGIGILGAALGGATLVLFLVASLVLWRALGTF